jgi:hypothetical protein
MTYGLEGRRSIQLSYGRSAGAWNRSRTNLRAKNRGARIRTEDLLLPKQAR